jgi:S1-C subfamily serine protease
VLVGDLVLDFDGQPVRSGDELLDLLHGDRVGRSVAVRLLRGTAVQSLAIVVGERPVG